MGVLYQGGGALLRAEAHLPESNETVYTLVLGSPPPAGAKLAVRPVLYRSTPLTLYFPVPGSSVPPSVPYGPPPALAPDGASGRRPRINRLAQILGFHEGTFSSGGAGSLSAPHCMDLDAPGYLLIDFQLDSFGATFSHSVPADEKQLLMGKCVLWSSGRYERSGALARSASGVAVVSRLRIRLLTPWHSLYNLHGKNWSCTLALATPQFPVRTDMP